MPLYLSLTNYIVEFKDRILLDVSVVHTIKISEYRGLTDLVNSFINNSKGYFLNVYTFVTY